jgi:hypothetical protein
MLTVTGKGGISATVVADSISEAGIRITTFELEYPRFIHAEMLTHRQFSRNAASSRAIPIEKVIEQVATHPATPIHWGKNQPGMKAKEEIDLNLEREIDWDDYNDEAVYGNVENSWCMGAQHSVLQAHILNSFGLHKQVVNRILEPYQMIKVVCTATEYENFFYLRDHVDAQPEIAELAGCMREAKDESKPQLLCVGEWHLPYLGVLNGQYFTTYEEGFGWVNEVELEDAIKISASLCAQVSYRKSDESLEKALKIYDMLVTMKPVHASPFEHQATPIDPSADWGLGSHCEGITHQDCYGSLWSGNLQGWIQNRQLIPNNVYKGE